MSFACKQSDTPRSKCQNSAQLRHPQRLGNRAIPITLCRATWATHATTSPRIRPSDIRPVSSHCGEASTGVDLRCCDRFRTRMANRPAGLRTHIVLCVAAATFGILTMEIVHASIFLQDSVKVDPIGVVEAGTTGVAFLAAGSILFSRGEIHGLTTGAGLWLSGAIGVACGLGLWQVAALGTLLVLVAAGLLYNLQPSLALAKIPYQGSQCREKKCPSGAKAEDRGEYIG